MQGNKKIIKEREELKKLLIGYNRKIQNEIKKHKINNINDINKIIKKYSEDFYKKYKIEIDNLDFLLKKSNIKYLIDIKSDFIKSMKGFILDGKELKNIPYIESKNLTELGLAFTNCKQANYLDNDKWNTPLVEDMFSTFLNNYKLNNIPIDLTSSKNLKNLALTFKNTSIQDLPEEIILPNVITMQETFNGVGLDKNINIIANNVLITDNINNNIKIIKENQQKNKNLNNNKIPNIKIYIDGSRLNKSATGPGGYAAYLETNYKNNKLIKIAYGNSLNATNNQMELIALISALKKLKKTSNLSIYSDSEYLVKSINNRLKNWKKNNWKNYEGKEIQNKDLWIEIDQLLSEHNINNIEWVKAHNDIYENEIVDTIARDEARKAEIIKKLLLNKINIEGLAEVEQIEVFKKINQINENDIEIINAIKGILVVKENDIEKIKEKLILSKFKNISNIKKMFKLH